ncbi:antibiotic ABC transporter permease [Serinicoccus chungangensis]|uniref:Transport permease protein n=1 Tax=Serinicoccus chungangensis TaxID=767452 RepID=A0A0W8I230_9MICO|nr:ABC transporter permease [Serinicoccus chungangensis]KUG51788.1 antibiotic ABC transporter permease [Serinicoccus chungangensis]
MNPTRTAATARRVLAQLRADRRTLALMLVVPCVLLGLLAWMSLDTPLFDRSGAQLLRLFPLLVMFVVTSVTTLAERTSGTLERLLSTPLGRTDFLAGYALAFGAMAVLQALVATGFAVWVCGLEVQGPVGWLVVVAVASGVLGASLGLLARAFARTEFQAVQFMPAFVLPQLLLCGLFVPRDQMPRALELLSAALPLSYAVDALGAVATTVAPAGELSADLAVLAAFVVGSLALASLTLRRRTP